MAVVGAGMRITGWGTALPDKIVTNHDLEATLDTSDAWIVERTGIHERRIGGTTAGLGADAGAAALARAGLDGSDIDVLVLATSTPDQALPASSAHVHELLGIRGGAFDLNAACSGFVYALVVGSGLVATGSRRVLVIGSDTMSRITDWDDRGTAILFADGAGAVVLEASDGPGALLSYDLGADGSTRHLLYADLGGTMIMDGREVFRRAVRFMVASVQACLDQAGVSIDQVALLVPHQANQRIIDAAASRLGLPAERTASVLAHTGNTSAGSVPLALVDAIDHGRLGAGDLAVLCGFGAGMTVATALVRWDGAAVGGGAQP
jgi:3-oxoacyl-[acyl-carrier-protein] synthase III